jgi:translation initiation factor 1A
MPNKKGGKKYKRNKNVNTENKTTRLKEEGQEYAQIKKCKGNCRFDVICFDGKERMAIMCGGMKKRVFVNSLDIVLVSIRTWQDSICDIIGKYNPSDVQKLKQKKLIPESIKFEEKNDVDDDEIMDDNLGFTFSYNLPDENDDDGDDDGDTTSEDDVDHDIDIVDI